MTKITAAHIDNGTVTEDDVHFFTAFASDLRLAGFPARLDTTLGNGQPFLCTGVERANGDVRWASYRQGNGCLTLRLFND